MNQRATNNQHQPQETEPLNASKASERLEPSWRAQAEQGIAGSAQPLPHLDTIQASFGRHDVRAIQAHVGGDAKIASAALGAEAYAMGEHVAFAAPPDLKTAAHEAAHVVQQRGGVQLAEGIDTPGDAYEQHAEAVADAVVSGGSAEALLDAMADAGERTGADGEQAVQRSVVSDAIGDLASPSRTFDDGSDALSDNVLHMKEPLMPGQYYLEYALEAQPKAGRDGYELLGEASPLHDPNQQSTQERFQATFSEVEPWQEGAYPIYGGVVKQALMSSEGATPEMSPLSAPGVDPGAAPFAEVWHHTVVSPGSFHVPCVKTLQRGGTLHAALGSTLHLGHSKTERSAFLKGTEVSVKQIALSTLGVHDISSPEEILVLAEKLEGPLREANVTLEALWSSPTEMETLDGWLKGEGAEGNLLAQLFDRGAITSKLSEVSTARDLIESHLTNPTYHRALLQRLHRLLSDPFIGQRSIAGFLDNYGLAFKQIEATREERSDDEQRAIDVIASICTEHLSDYTLHAESEDATLQEGDVGSEFAREAARLQAKNVLSTFAQSAGPDVFQLILQYNRAIKDEYRKVDVVRFVVEDIGNSRRNTSKALSQRLIQLGIPSHQGEPSGIAMPALEGIVEALEGFDVREDLRTALAVEWMCYEWTKSNWFPKNSGSLVNRLQQRANVSAEEALNHFESSLTDSAESLTDNEQERTQITTSGQDVLTNLRYQSGKNFNMNKFRVLQQSQSDLVQRVAEVSRVSTISDIISTRLAHVAETKTTLSHALATHLMSLEPRMTDYVQGLASAHKKGLSGQTKSGAGTAIKGLSQIGSTLDSSNMKYFSAGLGWLWSGTNAMLSVWDGFVSQKASIRAHNIVGEIRAYLRDYRQETFEAIENATTSLRQQISSGGDYSVETLQTALGKILEMESSNMLSSSERSLHDVEQYDETMLSELLRETRELGWVLQPSQAHMLAMEWTEVVESNLRDRFAKAFADLPSGGLRGALSF